MSQSVNILTHLLLASVRDPQGAFHTHSLVLDLLARCETILNDALRLNTASTTITLNPFQSFYDLQGYLPSSISILDVREGQRSLSHVESIDDFAALSRTWLQQTRPRHECWCQLGETYLCVYPTQSVSSTLEIVSTVLAGPYNSLPSDLTGITADYTHLLLLLTRVLLQLRARQFDALKATLDAFTASFQLMEDS